MVLPVDQHDIDRRARKRLRGFQAAKTAADDHDFRAMCVRVHGHLLETDHTSLDGCSMRTRLVVDTRPAARARKLLISGKPDWDMTMTVCAASNP